MCSARVLKLIGAEADKHLETTGQLITYDELIECAPRIAADFDVPVDEVVANINAIVAYHNVKSM